MRLCIISAKLKKITHDREVKSLSVKIFVSEMSAQIFISEMSAQIFVSEMSAQICCFLGFYVPSSNGPLLIAAELKEK